MRESSSLPEMLADLEHRTAFHRDQVDVHARQESFHHDEKIRHAAALEQAEQQLAVLRTAAEGAAAFLQEAPALPREAPSLETPATAETPRQVSKLVALAVQSWPAGRSFGASQVAEEVNRRLADALAQPVPVSTVGQYLLRLRKAGKLRTVRKGVSHAESLYQRA